MHAGIILNPPLYTYSLSMETSVEIGVHYSSVLRYNDACWDCIDSTSVYIRSVYGNQCWNWLNYSSVLRCNDACWDYIESTSATCLSILGNTVKLKLFQIRSWPYNFLFFFFYIFSFFLHNVFSLVSDFQYKQHNTISQLGWIYLLFHYTKSVGMNLFKFYMILINTMTFTTMLSQVIKKNLRISIQRMWFLMVCFSFQLFLNQVALLVLNEFGIKWAKPSSWTFHCATLNQKLHICKTCKIKQTSWLKKKVKIRQILKVPDPKSLENEFSLNWQIWSLFLLRDHPWRKNCKYVTHL